MNKLYENLIGFSIILLTPFIIGVLIFASYLLLIPRLIKFKKIERDKAELYARKINGTTINDNNFFKE